MVRNYLAILLASLSLSVNCADKSNLLQVADSPEAAAVELSTQAGHAIEFTHVTGQVTLLHFWATWCAPCVEELPSLQALQQDQTLQAVRILAIAADSHQAVARFTAQHHVVLPILFDQYGAAMRQYRVKALPASYLIDKQGHVRYRAYGKVRWDDAEVRRIMRQLLREAD